MGSEREIVLLTKRRTRCILGLDLQSQVGTGTQRKIEVWRATVEQSEGSKQ